MGVLTGAGVGVVMFPVGITAGVWETASVGDKLAIVVGGGMGDATVDEISTGVGWIMAWACAASTVEMASAVQ